MFPALIYLQSVTVDSNSVETTVHAYLITEYDNAYVYGQGS